MTARVRGFRAGRDMTSARPRGSKTSELWGGIPLPRPPCAAFETLPSRGPHRGRADPILDIKERSRTLDESAGNYIETMRS